MDNHQDLQNNSQIMQNSNDRASYNSACCFDSLLNSADDNYVKDLAIFTPTVFISDYTIAKYDQRIKSISLREHGPPDLQVLHSSFQI